jgi:hypothetical protein
MEKREGCSASKLLGLRESKGLRIWLIVATFRKYSRVVHYLGSVEAILNDAQILTISL